ncbi:MAG: hypothetical protein A3F67_02365 [Verrucomicrobia bacterium RIFCSPHIGHO2_12_FULL_41_10]|nr:MAG: hypothetical protein A3F67_02365 [Verrucomicrobia bacterium RIFCSPHIGHO2_12_FULL_41_10]
MELLLKNQVKFIVVGGLAVAMNGVVRTTDDIDILIDDSVENIVLLLQTLKSFGEGYASELSPQDFIDEEGAIRIIEAFPLDIFIRMQGMKYDSMQTMTAQYTMPYGLTVPFLHAKGLIKLKAGSLREKDQFDVIALKSLLQKEQQLK